MEQIYSLYLKQDNEYFRYGIGEMKYIRELLYDYLVINDMYNHKEVEFKIKKLIVEQGVIDYGKK